MRILSEDVSPPTIKQSTINRGLGFQNKTSLQILATENSVHKHQYQNQVESLPFTGKIIILLSLGIASVANTKMSGWRLPA